jgi:hypothetical protein
VGAFGATKEGLMEREEATTTYRGVAILRGTAKAVLVRFADKKEAWVPQSVIHDDSPCWRPGDRGDLVVYEWWASKREGGRG